MKYRYYELNDSDTVICYEQVKDLPIYPHALRFKSTTDLVMYWDAKKQFIQSTKIPASCKKCPIKVPCLVTIEQHDCCGDTQCRNTWRKIWEYVK